MNVYQEYSATTKPFIEFANTAAIVYLLSLVEHRGHSSKRENPGKPGTTKHFIVFANVEATVCLLSLVKYHRGPDNPQNQDFILSTNVVATVYLSHW